MSGVLTGLLGEGGAALGGALAEGTGAEAAAANLGRAAGRAVAQKLTSRRKKCNDNGMAFPDNGRAFPDCDDNGGKAFR